MRASPPASRLRATTGLGQRAQYLQPPAQEVFHGNGAAQVPPPSQRVLPWERELEDGTIVSTIKEDSSGEGILSLTLGTLGKLVLRAASGVARKLNLL